MASYFWREIFYVPFPGTPGKIPGNSGSTELMKEFGTTLIISITLLFKIELNLLGFYYPGFLDGISTVGSSSSSQSPPGIPSKHRFLVSLKLTL